MPWSERLKLAWTTFKREALPLYGWTLIFTGICTIVIVAMVVGVLFQLRWAFPQLQSIGESFSSGMPIPGIPPSQGLTPFAGPFSSPHQDPFAAFGRLGNVYNILSAFGSLVGTFLLIIIFVWLAGCAFYTGLFNLTTKAYHEKVTFRDFRLTGFFRFLGWQGVLLLIKVILLIIGLIGAFSLIHFKVALAAFFIAYGLLIVIVVLFALPWLMTSAIYLLANRNERFGDAFRGSWRFFRRHRGSLWGYLGTVILIEIAVQILSKISQGIAGVVTLVVSPFIAVLAIVWVLSLKDGERLETPAPIPMQTLASTITSPAAHLPTVSDSISGPQPPETEVEVKLETTPGFRESKISLEKTETPTLSEPLPSFSEEKPRYCPSCGKVNSGTAYCPQCGTKL
ncbi:zinc ribbon domain-containing protein [Desulfosporosinus sp. Sb-LF]|uniref:zinc ribbon domain-containing protein n=1 Tax=Desulfosporosinus sp. Sb-LF TaxID=2560027 RepID=UPI001FB052E1|nr:zinc ribbon domain-containing protein [Desulfosporosinus sp. Sb-LF]